MPRATLRQLLEAGVHFGHQTSRWNPKMRPFLFGARNGVHIIDLVQTQSRLDEACDFLRDLVEGGQKVLFVGTKKQAQDAIGEACAKSGQFYVTHRWMGGMLTNFQVIQRRLKQLADLQEMRDRGDFERMSRKEANVNEDELDRLERNFGGMQGMRRLPGALFVVDCKKERLAVAEARRLNIPIVAITDSNVDPDDIAYPIPGNDDAIRAVRLIVNLVNDAIVEGQQLHSEREIREAQEQQAQAEREREQAEAAAAAVADEKPEGGARVSEEEFAAAARAGGAEEA